MTSFLALLKNDARLFLRDWKACTLLLAAPLLLISFFTYALAPYLDKDNFIEPFSIAMVDMENTPQTRMLVKQLDEMSIFSEVRRLDEKTAMQKLSAKEVGAVVIIPQDFTGDIAAGENKPISVIGSSAMALQAYVVRNVIQSAANLVSAAQSAIMTIYHYSIEAGLSGKELDLVYNNAVTDFFLEALARNEVFADTEDTSEYSLTPAEYFSAALIVVFMMFAGMPGMKMLVAERSEGVTRRLSASPVRIWKVVLSKLIISALLLILQFGIIIMLTLVFFRNYWGAPVKNVLMLFGGIILAVSAWSVFAAAISSSTASADIIGNLGILLMAVIGGSIYPISTMPDFIRNISRLTINRWAMDGFMVLFSGNDAASTGVYALALVIIGLVLFALSAFVLRIRRG